MHSPQRGSDGERSMTNSQAAKLQAKWKEQVDPPACMHPSQELESAGGYLTGSYHCSTCGESVPKRQW